MALSPYTNGDSAPEAAGVGRRFDPGPLLEAG